MNSLRILRAAGGVTLEELASKLDIAPSTISRWERGIVEPSNEAQAERAFRLVAARVSNPRLVEALRVG